MKYDGYKVKKAEYGGARSVLTPNALRHMDDMWKELEFYRSHENCVPKAKPKLKAYEGLSVSKNSYADLHANFAHQSYAPLNAQRIEQLWAEVQHYRAQVEGKTEANTVEVKISDEPNVEARLKHLETRFELYVNRTTAKIDSIAKAMSQNNAWIESTAETIQAIREFNGNMEQRVSALHKDMESAGNRIEKFEKNIGFIDIETWFNETAKVIGKVADLEKHVRDGEAFDELRKLIAEKHIKQDDAFTVSVKTGVNGKSYIEGVKIMETPKPEIEIKAGMRFQAIGSSIIFTLIQYEDGGFGSMIGNMVYRETWSIEKMKSFVADGKWVIVK